MRTLALTTLVATGLAGAAFAGEPFVLGGAQMDSVTAAGEVIFNTDVDKTVDIAKNVNLNVSKTVLSSVDLTGNLATAEASADAIEFENNLAEVDTFAQVDATGAFAFAESLAAGIGVPTAVIGGF